MAIHVPKMGLCVPFVNDDAYIDGLIGLSTADAQRNGQHEGQTATIFEVYGSLPTDIVGNLRPAASVRPTTMAQLTAQIAKLHAHGIRFNYVMNSELLPIPLTARYEQDVLRFVGELSECGVDEITLTNPRLITLIHRRYGHLRINASICNEISSVREALEFEELGAGVIVLDRDVNRDFGLIRAIRRQASGDIKVLCNSACVYHCINVHYHGTYSSALSSSSLGWLQGRPGAADEPYCSFYCRHRFFADPAELIRMHWIRPEDVVRYAQAGVTLFKLDGRDKDPAYLLQVVGAYLAGTYNGNFFHLLQPEFCEQLDDLTSQGGGTGDRPIGATSSDSLANPTMDDERLEILTQTYLREERPWPLAIRNRDLDGFVDAFAQEHVLCRGNCAECRYCDSWAKKIVCDPVWLEEMSYVMRRNYERR